MALQFDDTTNQTWEEVRSDSAPTNWMILGLDDANKNQVNLIGKGNGGFDEFVQSLDESKVFFGVVRVTAVDDDSRRTKFIMITWIGEKVSPLKRARVSTLKSGFEMFFKGIHCEFVASNTSDLDKADIEKKLNSSTGAHKPKGYEWI